MSEEGEVQPLAEGNETGERQAQLHTIASDLLYWKGGLKVLRQAPLPKWRGSFRWQIEAKTEALQAVYARLRTEAAMPCLCQKYRTSPYLPPILHQETVPTTLRLEPM